MSGYKTFDDSFLIEVTENLAENSPSVKLSKIIYILKDGINILKDIDKYG